MEELTCPKAVSDINDAKAIIEIGIGPLRFMVGCLLGVK